MHHDYHVIQFANLLDVMWEVNNYLDVGYKLAGGISAVVDPKDPSSILYSQAVIWEGESGTLPNPHAF